MKIRAFFRVCTTVFLIVSLLIIYGGAGCSSGETKAYVSTMIDRLPADITTFTIMDVNALKDGEDLEEAYQAWENYESWIQEEYGIDYHQAAIVVHAGHSEDEVVLSIYDGDFALEQVTGSLKNLGYQSSKYKDQEVWGDNSTMVAPLANLITIGREDYLKNCIGAMTDSYKSLGSNFDIRDVIDRLPGGILVSGGTDQRHEGLKAWGLSIRKKNSDTLRLDYIYKFENEMQATEAVWEIMCALAEVDLLPPDVNTSQGYVSAEQEYVKAFAYMEVRDFEVVFASFFPMVNRVNAANSELMYVQFAISGCIVEAYGSAIGNLITEVEGWDGRAGVVLAQSPDGTVIKDAADYLNTMNRDTLKATYDIKQTGFVYQGHNISWRQVQWDNEKASWIEAP